MISTTEDVKQGGIVFFFNFHINDLINMWTELKLGESINEIL